jgi:hypothetical protein
LVVRRPALAPKDLGGAGALAGQCTRAMALFVRRPTPAPRPTSVALHVEGSWRDEPERQHAHGHGDKPHQCAGAGISSEALHPTAPPSWASTELTIKRLKPRVIALSRSTG